MLRISILFVLALFGCKESFTPVVSADNSNILVVEGFINSGSDSTIIKLSRTVVVAKNTTANPEIGSVVSVESETNEIFNLTELPAKKGTYVALALNLNPAKKYRLRIKTANGASYLSDLSENKISPAIDNFSSEVKDDKVRIFINTHDPSRNTRYYRWDYTETWVFYSLYRSILIWDGRNFQNRDNVNNNINQCWKTQPASTIFLGSSAKLDQDVINNYELITIPLSSEKVSERYSIIVRQYALTKEAYDYWEALKKNTESLGSIFDAQPTQLTGNIHNVNNPSEPVIGYVSVGTTRQQRIYILKKDLPFVRTVYPYDCSTTYIKEEKPGDGSFPNAFGSGVNIPLEYAGAEILASSRECADCTIRGSNKKPDFWP